MHVVSIFNNKGGVGKSTLTVCLAEFLTTNLKKKVLVIDLDAQASSSCSLLGKERILDAINNGHNIVDLVRHLLTNRRKEIVVDDFLTLRPGVDQSRSALKDLQVLVPNKPGMDELEEELRWPRDATLFRDYLKRCLQDFDYVLIDLPGNLKKRELGFAGLVMSDFVLLPVEISQMSLGGMPDTVDLIQKAQVVAGNGRPEVVGIVCNRVDGRTQQHKAKVPALQDLVKRGAIPPLFEHTLPDTPKLQTATDELIDFSTLQEKFDTYYDKVRRVAIELHNRCEMHTFDSGPDLLEARGYLQQLFTKLKRVAKSKRPKATRAERPASVE